MTIESDPQAVSTSVPLPPIPGLVLRRFAEEDHVEFLRDPLQFINARARPRWRYGRRTLLGVDATNPTGALRVYESMEFAPISRSTTYRKVIVPGS